MVSMKIQYITLSINRAIYGDWRAIPASVFLCFTFAHSAFRQLSDDRTPSLSLSLCFWLTSGPTDREREAARIYRIERKKERRKLVKVFAGKGNEREREGEATERRNEAKRVRKKERRGLRMVVAWYDLHFGKTSRQGVFALFTSRIRITVISRGVCHRVNAS